MCVLYRIFVGMYVRKYILCAIYYDDIFMYRNI